MLVIPTPRQVFAARSLASSRRVRGLALARGSTTMKVLVLVATICLSLGATARAAPAWSIELGARAGAIDSFLTTGVTIGAAQRLGQTETASLWVRESASANLLGKFLDSGSGALYRGTVGLDLHALCDAPSHICVLVGVAGGYLREDFEGAEFAIFSPGDPISVHDTRPIVVSRLGIEFTGVNVRVTPIVEIVASPGQSTGAEAGLGIGFAW
jgi:hypothetical protein